MYLIFVLNQKIFMWDLEGKIALITGGTKGIGKTTVEEFLDLKARVIFTSRSKKNVEDLENSLTAKGFEVYGIVGDVSNHQDLERIRDFVVQKFERLDILVNNAGINIRKDATAYTTEEYRQILDINLFAPFELSRLLHPLLKKSGKASIINIASVAANQDVKSGAPYGMAKSGLLQQTRNLAVEWAQDNIRVNAVSPWYTETPLTASVFKNTERFDKIVERTPMKRVAQPIEMANAIAFLAMDKSSYITGQNIILDGGMSISAL